MKYRLGDIAPIKQGVISDSEDYWLLNLDAIESNTGRIIEYFFAGEDEIGASTVVFDTENVLYSKLRPYLNKVVLPQQCGYATSEMLPLRPNINIITREYLTYFLRSPKFVGYINEKTSGAKMPRANTSDLMAVEIDCPPIDKQNEITKLFDRLVSIIELRKKEITILDDLIKARFVELFGEYYNNHINEKQLDEICDFIDYRGKTPEKSESGIPLITAKNVKDNRFSIEPQEFIPEENYDDVMTRGIPRVNDVLFTTEAPLGNVCRIPDVYERFCVGQRLITMQPHTDVINSEYLEHALASAEFQEKMWQKSSGSTVKGIRSKLLVLLTIPVPPIELQNQFRDFVHQVDKSKVVVKKALDEAQLLFDSLMQKYFG